MWPVILVSSGNRPTHSLSDLDVNSQEIFFCWGFPLATVGCIDLAWTLCVALATPMICKYQEEAGKSRG